ncbi:MAG: glycosyl hydrolase family 18 protein [Anaerovoracaceae bacterium]
MDKGKMKKKIFVVSIVVLLCCAAAIAGLTTSMSSYGSNESTIPIYFEGKRLSEGGYIVNQTPYVPLSVAKKIGETDKLVFDEAGKKMLIDLSRHNIRMADKETTDFVKKYGGTVYIPLKTFDGTLCVPIDVSGQFMKLHAYISDGTIRINRADSTDKAARVTERDTKLVPNLSSKVKQDPIKLNSGDIVYILGETDNYYRIETQYALTGYVMKTHVETLEDSMSSVDFYAPKKNKYLRGKEKINLVWQYASATTPAPPEKKEEGIDILAPTWFHLIVGGNGNVENTGDLSYTRSAHEKGYLVWATITNNMSTKGSTAYTSTVFNNSALLNRSVAQYLFYSCLYDVDGINIDYEQVAYKDAAGLTAFTALLRQYTERQGLNLSIDTLIPKPWTIEYDRDALAEHVDYIAVMTYDEHYSTSPTAGSVASLPWVEEAIRETLKEVPREKVLLGVPLYTRVWVVDNSEKVIRNPAASMGYIQDLIVNMNLTPVWLDREKQYFISYPNGEYTDKIWVEDIRSVANRLALVQKYDLAGSACWEYRWSMPDIWQVFSDMLKQGRDLSYYENRSYYQ